MWQPAAPAVDVGFAGHCTSFGSHTFPASNINDARHEQETVQFEI